VQLIKWGYRWKTGNGKKVKFWEIWEIFVLVNEKNQDSILEV